MKKYVTMKFPITRRKVGFRRKARYVYETYVGEYPLSADSVEHLEQQVNDFITHNAKPPEIALSTGKTRKVYISIARHNGYNGFTETYTQVDPNCVGLSFLRSIGSSGKDVVDEARLFAQHLEETEDQE